MAPKQVEIYLTSRQEQQGAALLRDLKRRLDIKGREPDEALSRLMSEGAESEKDVRAVLLIRPDGRVLAKTLGDGPESDPIPHQSNPRQHPPRPPLSNAALSI